MNLDNIHQTRWPSHTFGSCFVNHRFDKKHPLIYVNVPKCATEWAKPLFGGVRTNLLEINDPNAEYVVILRDPYDRWVSGVMEYLKRYSGIGPNTTCFNNLDTLKLLTTSGATDEHTELQARFLPNVPFKQTTFFHCDEYLTKNIQHWFKEKNYPLHHHKDKSHTMRSNWAILAKTLKEKIDQNPTLKNAVLNYLAPDIKLYNSVQYYRRGE